MHYFARALRAWPQKRVVALEAVRMDGLGWLSESNRGTLVLRCRPTGASAAQRVATIHISSGGKALATPWQLEGDIKLEVGTPLYFQLLLFVSYLSRSYHVGCRLSVSLSHHIRLSAPVLQGWHEDQAACKQYLSLSSCKQRCDLMVRAGLALQQAQEVERAVLCMAALILCGVREAHPDTGALGQGEPS